MQMSITGMTVVAAVQVTLTTTSQTLIALLLAAGVTKILSNLAAITLIAASTGYLAIGGPASTSSVPIQSGGMNIPIIAQYAAIR